MCRRRLLSAPVVGFSMIGTLRSSPSLCAFSFSAPRCMTYRALQGSTCSSGVEGVAKSAAPNNISIVRRRRLCCWAAATEAVPDVGRKVAGLEDFENELGLMVTESEDGEGEEELSNDPPSPCRLSLLDSNVRILEQDCIVAKLFVDAATSRVHNLYLGLDISTQSTGYAVLRPATVSPGNAASEGVVREAGEASLVEWGCIAGSGSGSKKKDVVDVGFIVEEALAEVARRCGHPRGRCSDAMVAGGLGCSEGEGLHGEADGPTWVVGVEDFMRRFLPGRSNARSIFALAQLNGIVKYACQKHLGAKADSYHPSTPRSFYGLMQNKPEGKGMKEIVHDFALSQENGALESRYDWPLSSDGSKADSSYDVTDAYLVARYAWHRDVFRAVADDQLAKQRFAESFQAQHAGKLSAAGERALKMFMAGEMPAARGKKKLKPMTERSARNAHRKLEDARVAQAYETALLHWFKTRVLRPDLPKPGN